VDLDPAGDGGLANQVQDLLSAFGRHVVEAEHRGHIINLQATDAGFDTADFGLGQAESGAYLAGGESGAFAEPAEFAGDLAGTDGRPAAGH
jgi:hypothetical protein